MPLRRLAVLCCAALVSISVARAETSLKPPFLPFESRTSPTTAVAAFKGCTAVPVPVVDLLFDGFYAPGTGSTIVDPAAMARYRETTQTINRFERELAEMGDAYQADAQRKGVAGDPAIAACALDWLAGWAKGRAMLGKVSQQGGYVRKWSLGTAATAYLRIRDAAGLPADKKQAVEGWIGEWARVVHIDYSTGTDRGSRNNNHAYWAALSVGMAAVVGNDQKLFAWAMEGYHKAAKQIGSDGTLPLELDRGPKALHYHLFALEALVPLAELGMRNGHDLYAEGNGALDRLIGVALAGLADPKVFEKRTGKKQDLVGELEGGDLAWMEPYYARFGRADLKPWIGKYRPMRNTRLGGNLTLMYGAERLDR